MLEMVWYQRGEQMVAAVSAVTRIPRAEIVGNSRKRHVVRARQVACWAMREVLQYSYPIIAKSVGRADHTTAMYACDVIGDLVKNDPDVRRVCDLVRQAYIEGAQRRYRVEKAIAKKKSRRKGGTEQSERQLKALAESHENMMRNGSRQLLAAIVQNHGYAFDKEPARACA